MSGSSTSRNRRSSCDVVEPPLERLADGHRRQGLEAGAGGRRQLGRWRQDLVEVLGDDVGDRLAAQRGVEDVRRDLRVEGDRQRLGGLVLGEGRDEERLDLVADERRAQPLEEVAAGRRRVGAVGGDDPAVRARPRRARAVVRGRGRGSSARSETPTAGCAASHGSRSSISVRADDLDPPRVEDRLGEGGRQVLGGLERPSPPAVTAAGAVRRRRPAPRPRRSRGEAAARRSPGRGDGRPAPQPSGRPPPTRAAGT